MKIADIGKSELDIRQTGEARLQEICNRFGLENAAYAHIDKSRNVVHGCTTFPAAWANYYVENDLILADPLIRFGASIIAPVDWAVFESQPEFATLFQAAKAFGVGEHGISVPVINPFGERGLFTVTSNMSRLEWDALIPKILPSLRHEAQILHLLALDVIDSVISFPSDALSDSEQRILKMLAAGLLPAVITRQTGFSSQMVESLTTSVLTKLKSRTTEQAIARAVSANLLKWTEFFADPVAEIVDMERQRLCGGIVRWAGKSHELIPFEDGRFVRQLDSFQKVRVEVLAAEFKLDPEEIGKMIGQSVNQHLWVRYF